MSVETKKEIKEWVLYLVVTFAIINIFLVGLLFRVDGYSMYPTLTDKELLISNKFVYHIHAPEKGDIIVFEYPQDKTRTFVKRVIATEGDTVEVKNGKVYVNDQEMNERYIWESTAGYYPKTTVPEGTVFAMGDNRNNSKDSRFADVGFIPYDIIKGKVMAGCKTF